jgi:hypothetical protein
MKIMCLMVYMFVYGFQVKEIFFYLSFFMKQF